MTNMAVRINFNLNPTIAKDTFSHYGDHIDIFHLLADDKRRRLVIGIGGSCPHSRDKLPVALNNITVPTGLFCATV